MELLLGLTPCRAPLPAWTVARVLGTPFSHPLRGITLCGVAVAVVLCSCKREPVSPAPAMPQRAYVWQRDWNQRVTDAIARSRGDLAGYVILACEIEWRNGRPHPVIPEVDWPGVRDQNTTISPAIRVMPYPGPFAEDDATIRFLCETAGVRLAAIRATGIEPRELQLDFDCAQKKLAGYAKWVRALRITIAPLPLVITTLPCWLDEPEFPNLVRAASGYVLQVHSIASPRGPDHSMVCDPDLARGWTARASAIGVPFQISLPTYRTIAGYDASGRNIGSYADGTQAAWPPGTTVREYATDLDAMAALVASWQARHPDHCTGLLWYRLPVASDHQNCPWPALRALTQGRAPIRSWAVRINGRDVKDQEPTSLVDVSLVNTGETDELSMTAITLSWEKPAKLVLAEPLAGWRMTCEDNQVTFKRADPHPRLTLEQEHAIGWVRLDNPARIQAYVQSQ